MKSIENNIGRHENGNLYFISRKKGKLNRKSLGTKCLNEARRKVRELGTLALTSAREPAVPLLEAVDLLERVMKRFAKGFEIDLTFFHAFRHYFASRCLLSGFTVQEVAKLLGHSDNGVLALKTYGHICSDHMKARLAGLRLTGR